ncbi:MAG: phosphonate C-P lyase system protein PhnH [Meiothermus sp.]
MTPICSAQEAQERQTFLALMWALSRPGEAKPFGSENGLENMRVANSAMQGLEYVGEAVLDLETSFYTKDPGLRQRFERRGARFLGPEQAAYQFYPAVGERELASLREAPVGTLLSPEQSATVVVRCAFERGLKLQLSGPGVKDLKQIQVNGPPRAFWALREERVSFPLGWDVFLVSSTGNKHRVVGIPRSTNVEVVG